MGRTYSHNEAGFKQRVRVLIDGVAVARTFHNKGEAIQYLQKQEDMTKDDIRRRVRFTFE
jgi:hypothetical protein